MFTLIRGGQQSDSSTTVDLHLAVSKGFSRTLQDLASKTGSDVGEVLAKALILLAIAVEAKQRGEKIAVVGRTETNLTEITGL